MCGWNVWKYEVSPSDLAPGPIFTSQHQAGIIIIPTILVFSNVWKQSSQINTTSVLLAENLSKIDCKGKEGQPLVVECKFARIVKCQNSLISFIPNIYTLAICVTFCNFQYLYG